MSDTTTAAAKSVAGVLNNPSLSTDQLEEAIKAVLEKQQKAKVEAAKPREPDWANVSEQDAYKRDFYVPVIEHELPSYMDIKLADPQYEVVWSSCDQRRIGQLQAMGYELLKKEHIKSDFKLPLLFNSEGLYKYVDVVAMRVHKKILYGKRRQALQVSLNQLSNRNRPPRVREANSYNLASPIAETDTFGKGSSLYSDIM